MKEVQQHDYCLKENLCFFLTLERGFEKVSGVQLAALNLGYVSDRRSFSDPQRIGGRNQRAGYFVRVSASFGRSDWKNRL